MTVLQSIDPGKPKRKHLGRALFRDGRLICCGLWDLESPPWECDTCAIEKPIVYMHSPVPPNDILDLAITFGRAGQAVGWLHVYPVLPRQWKGTVDGTVLLPRIIATLHDAERRVYFAAADAIPEGVREHVIDAIGLGLWWLKRPFAP